MALPELFANDPQTTLSVGINNTMSSLTVASSAGFPAAASVGGQFRIRVGNELMLVTDVVGNGWTVTRGIEGTVAASHSAGAAVSHVLTAGAMIAAGAASAHPSPEDFGFKAWTVTPVGTGANTVTTTLTGRSIYTRTALRVPSFINRVCFGVRTAGATFAVGNEIGLYDATGTLLTKTGDLSTVWNSTGYKEAAFDVQMERPAGTYYLAALNNSTTLVAFLAQLGDGISAFLTNAGTATTRLGYQDATTRTALPASINYASLGAQATVPVMALS